MAPNDACLADRKILDELIEEAQLVAAFQMTRTVC